MMNILRIKQRAFGALLLFLLASVIASGCGDNPIDDSVICCKLADGTISSETTSDCKEAGGNPVDEELCACDDDVCCENDDGTFQTLPESQCDNVAAAERCVDVSPDDDVCCKTDSGLQTLPASECPEEQTVADDMCTDDDVCCKNSDGTFQTLPGSECPDAQTVAAEMCTDDDVCCKNSDGTYQTLPESQCENISPDPELCLGGDDEICCRINGQFVNVAASQCPDGSVAPADMCVEDLDVCCKTAAGVMTVPGSECPAGQELAAEMCAEICCETETGVQLLPAAQCEPQQVISDDVCAREVCCETIDGYETLPQSSCPSAQISDALFCEDDVCCNTGNGINYVPANQCEPTMVLADERCITPETECVKFRAVDMSTLPYTTTDGDTLQSFTSFWGTFSVQTGWSSSCFDHPAGAERAHTGFGNDLVLNFAAPVSSIFLLRYNAQPGDELVVPGANLAPTFCGASSYHNITQVDLATPSSTVTVQDASPDGGTGYSVLLAECIEWAQN
jgi:hypothetical protein